MAAQPLLSHLPAQQARNLMSAKIQVIGKSREAIATALRKKRTEELFDIIYELATLEPFFSPRTIAQARGISQRRIVALCQARTLRAHKISDNNWRVPLSAVREWDENTAVKLNGN